MTSVFRGAAFSSAADGDLRGDGSRDRFSARVGAPLRWATADQVHGTTVHVAVSEGPQGEGDALVTETPGLAVAVFTADCAGVVVVAEGAVAVLHAGWRGAAAGIVDRALGVLRDRGHEPVRAAIGPAIGPCCYEVGPEVAELFPDHRGVTTWGSRSIDLPGFVASRLDGLETVRVDACTRCDEAFFSHRRDATANRQAAIGWIPSNR